MSWMKIALAEAHKAKKEGEVPVGAVLLTLDGLILAQSHNRVIQAHDPSAHAEMMVLRAAGSILGNYRLIDTILCTSLEPCLMCYSAMVHARISHLIYGAFDCKGGIFSSGIFPQVEKVYNHEVSVLSGICAEESSAILTQFFKVRRGARAVEWDGLENR